MRTLKFAEKQNQLRKMMNLIEPLKLDFGQLPSIRQRDQNTQNNKIKSYQASPKVFINSQEALVWIKKDYNRKTKHDLLEMIRKKAEEQFLIEKSGASVKERQVKTKKNHSHMLRKYSSTTKNIKQKSKLQRKSFNVNDQQQQLRRNRNFLSIQVLETQKSMPRPSINSRTRTQKSKMQTIDTRPKQPKQKEEMEIKNKIKIKMKSQGKFIHKSKLEQNSFRPQFLSPW